MSRLPIRVRLTLTFVVAMAVVLAATGAFLYFRLQSSLDESIAETLEQRALEIDARTARGETLEGLPVAADEGFGQVLGPDGRLFDVDLERRRGARRRRGAARARAGGGRGHDRA